MNQLIKNARIVCPASPWNGKTCDILIEDGVIKKTGSRIAPLKDVETIEHENLHASAGWFDPSVHFCDPGEEFKEDLTSGSQAAAAGGFTGVGLLPVTQPPLTTKAQIEYIINQSKKLSVEIIPYGCLSHELDGENLSEMLDMHKAGARAFTDHLNPVNAGLLLRAMQYMHDYPVAIFSHPTNLSLCKGALMHEGKINIHLGLKGMPSVAEEISVARDIFLVRYNQSPLHLFNISTSGSVALIRQAKKEGLPVTAQVSVHHLYFTDSHLEHFDTNLKLSPPLRSKSDVDALIEGIHDGTIDCVTSHHFPQDIESKKVEFDQALPGATGLEAMFGALGKVSHNKISLEKRIEILTCNPRRLLGLDVPVIKEGEKANLTLFNPDAEFIFDVNMLKSRGVNCPYIGKPMKGKVIKTILRKNP